MKTTIIDIIAAFILGFGVVLLNIQLGIEMKFYTFVPELIIFFIGYALIYSVVLGIYNHYFYLDIKKAITNMDSNRIRHKLDSIPKRFINTFDKSIFEASFYFYKNEEYDDFLKYITKLTKRWYGLLRYYWLFHYNVVMKNTSIANQQFIDLKKRLSAVKRTNQLTIDLNARVAILGKLKDNVALTENELEKAIQIFQDPNVLKQLTKKR